MRDTVPMAVVSYSLEDEIGPAWGEPYGCCFGECETETAQAFREYHGIEEAFREERRQAELEARKRAKEWRAKLRRRKIRRQPCEIMRALCGLESPHQLPKRLRCWYW